LQDLHVDSHNCATRALAEKNATNELLRHFHTRISCSLARMPQIHRNAGASSTIAQALLTMANALTTGTRSNQRRAHFAEAANLLNHALEICYPRIERQPQIPIPERKNASQRVTNK
jgi:hypothetical protein